jgi:ATP-dependent DNA helicase RecQ
MSTFDFDYNELISTYQLQNNETFYALKRLEEQQFIQFNEYYFAPSKLHFSVDNEALYEFRLFHKGGYDSFVKGLLRMYGGELFTNFTTIHENQIASKLLLDHSEVVTKLKYMHQVGVAIYEPQKDKPQITFLTERYNAADLPFDIKKMEARKKYLLEKAAAVINYVTHTHRCRTLILLDYFNEQDALPCGVCDICLQHKKIARQTANENKWEQTIFQLLKEKPLTIKELTTIVNPMRENEFISFVRTLIESGEIVFENNQLRL